MSNKFRNIFVLLVLGLSAFAQKNEKAPEKNVSEREFVVETIISFKGDFSLDSVKIVKAELKKIGINYLGYCVDQKCMLVSVVYKDENTLQWILDQTSEIAPGAVLGLKQYPLKEYIQQCEFSNDTEAAYFKNRYDQ